MMKILSLEIPKWAGRCCEPKQKATLW